MTRFQQICLVIWSTVVGLVLCLVLMLTARIAQTQQADHQTLVSLHTDNQTILELRNRIAELKINLTDTEIALDKAALDANRLELDNEVLRARVETSEKRHNL